ncbi:hypothetical protein KC356_g167 [Hortaea werneckii]|nr:hypothetical protein KC356_g167 [Hortaea werneckii]
MPSHKTRMGMIVCVVSSVDCAAALERSTEGDYHQSSPSFRLREDASAWCVDSAVSDRVRAAHRGKPGENVEGGSVHEGEAERCFCFAPTL